LEFIESQTEEGTEGIKLSALCLLRLSVINLSMHELKLLDKLVHISFLVIKSIWYFPE